MVTLNEKEKVISVFESASKQVKLAYIMELPMELVAEITTKEELSDAAVLVVCNRVKEGVSDEVLKKLTESCNAAIRVGIAPFLPVELLLNMLLVENGRDVILMAFIQLEERIRQGYSAAIYEWTKVHGMSVSEFMLKITQRLN